jgi:ATP-dependent DNA helicase RecQ
MVPFLPADLAARLEMEPSSLSHALRELGALDAFTYVPPFRGRAIRMLRRDLEFDALDIDFETLQSRRQAEYDKLNRVVQFALSPCCRQGEILRYFGQAEPDPCGRCDNCTASVRTTRRRPDPPAPQEDVTRAVRIVLSGVARASKRFPCGKILIAQMLSGSASQRMEKLRLNRLSTFGLLHELTQPEVFTLIEGALAMGLLQQVDVEPNRPVLRVTDLGLEVMRGTRALTERLAIPSYLLAKLRRVGARSSVGQAAVESAARKPLGAGPASTSPSLPAARPRAASAPATPAAFAPTTPAGADPRPDYYWTWRLLAAGFPAEECCQIRGMTLEAVLDHASRALDEGLPVRADLCLAHELISALDGLIGGEAPVDLRPILAQLPKGTNYQQVQLYVKCRGRRVRG